MSTKIEFGRKAAADEYREEYPDAICSEDDAQLKTVAFASSAPDWLLEQAELEALETRGRPGRRRVKFP